MPAPALLLLVPEGLGLLAGGAEALFGESLPTGVRDFLDTLDELSLINTALEGLGVMPSQPAETDVWKVARPMVSIGSMAIPAAGAIKGVAGATKLAKAAATAGKAAGMTGKVARGAGRIGSGLMGVGEMYSMFHRVGSIPEMFGVGVEATAKQAATPMPVTPTYMPTMIPWPQTLPPVWPGLPQPTGGPIGVPQPVTIPSLWG